MKSKYKIKGSKNYSSMSFTVWKRVKILFFYIWLPVTTTYGGTGIVEDDLNDAIDWYEIPEDMVNIKKNK